MARAAEAQTRRSGSVHSRAAAPPADENEKKTPPIIWLAQNGFVGDSIVDGPGLRCVLFFQGCPHGCEGCHNPATHAFSGGLGATAQALFERVKTWPLCRGVTFSGGEPFCQAQALLPLAALLRQNGYELAAYSGYTFEQLLAGSAPQRALLHMLDILVDGPFVLAEKDLTLRFRGSANQRVLNVPKSLEAGRGLWETDERWIGATQ